MIETPEQAQFIRDLRVQIQANKDAGKPEFTGIDDEKLREFISILRGNRAFVSKKNEPKGGRGKSRAVAGATDDELNSLFGL